MNQCQNFEDFFKCCKLNQISSQLYINVDKSLKLEERLLCEECLFNQQCKLETMPLSKVINQIQQLKNNQYSQLQQLNQRALQQITEFCDNIDCFKIQISNLVDKIILSCNPWKEELFNTIKQQQNYDLLFELQQFDFSDDQFYTKQLFDIETQFQYKNKLYLKKVNFLIQDLEDIIDTKQKIFEIEHSFDQIKLEQYENQQNKILDRQINYKLYTEIYQENWCGAINFNKQGTIMVSGYDSNIKVWNLQYGLPNNHVHILQGHKNQVYSIAFSKRFNWFLSGCSGDDNIISWKQTRNSNEWESDSTIETVSTVWCLILNEQENQLISSHDDGSIKVWEVNWNQNLIIFGYQLQKHSSFVYQISLNQKEDKLVSCSEDKEIIIWELYKNQIWQFKQIIMKNTDDYGQRITFINDDTIVWCQNQGQIHIFQQKDSKFIENLDQQFPLNVNSYSDQYNLFPLIYNKSKEILIVKHCEYVYLLQKQINNQLKLIGEPIIFESNCIQGNITNDGKYFVVWNMGTKSFRFYILN